MVVFENLSLLTSSPTNEIFFAKGWWRLGRLTKLLKQFLMVVRGCGTGLKSGVNEKVMSR